MTGPQRKLGLGVMIEIDLLPGFVGVAFCTIFTKTPPVYIIDLMAGNAVARGILVMPVRMAGITRGFLVFIVQGELGLAVIKGRATSPVGRFVTLTTFIAKVSLVHVLLAMT